MINENKPTWTMVDNRPRWIIYFDTIMWIGLIGILLIMGYQYFFGFTEVTLQCQGMEIGQGKVRTDLINYSLWEDQGWKVINETNPCEEVCKKT